MPNEIEKGLQVKDMLKKLQTLALLMKKFIEEGSNEVIDNMINDEFYTTFFGVMEWDPELFGKMENKFRELLIEKSYMVNGACIENKDI